MSTYIALLLRHRFAVLVTVGLVTVLAFASMTRMRLATSIGEQFIGDRPEYRDYLQKSAAFGSDEVIVIGVDEPPLAGVASISRMREIVDAISAMSDVARVDSVLNAQHVQATADGLRVAAYADEVEAEPRRTAAIRRALLEDPFAAGLVVGQKGASQVVVVELTRDPDRAAEEMPRLVAQILGHFERGGFGAWQLHRAGFLAVTAEAIEQTMYNVTILFPIVIVVLLLTVWLLFGRLWPAAIATGVGMLAVAWTFGFMAMINPKLHLLLTMAPPVILIVSFSDVVHLCNAYLSELAAGRDKDAAIRGAGVDVGKACLLTSATTFVGFASLAIVPNPTAQLLGLALGFGVGVALLLAMALVPVLFSLMPLPRPLRGGITAKVQGVIDRTLAWFSWSSISRPIWVIAAFGVLLAVSIAGSTQLSMEADFAKRFAEDNPIRRDQGWFNARFAGSNLLEVYVTAGEEAGLLDPDRLQRIAGLQTAIEDLDGVDSAVSLVDLFRIMHRALNAEDDQVGHQLPGTREALAQYLLLFEMAGGEEIERLVDFERKRMRIAVRLNQNGARATAALGQEVEAIGRSLLRDGTEVDATGLVFLLGYLFDDILAGEIRGLLLSFVVIAIMMALGVRSLRVGLISMVPNLLPLLILGGWVGATMPVVDTDVLIVAIMAIGIGVDDTIHFLMRYRVEVARCSDERDAIANTFGYAGRGIVMTTVILVAGFLPCATSEYFTLRMLGTLLPGCLVVALIADLALVPALVRVGVMRLAPPRAEGLSGKEVLIPGMT